MKNTNEFKNMRKKYQKSMISINFKNKRKEKKVNF